MDGGIESIGGGGDNFRPGAGGPGVFDGGEAGSGSDGGGLSLEGGNGVFLGGDAAGGEGDR